ncbi:hypothetical protein ScPMuIL_004218 [Solemya velum]
MSSASVGFPQDTEPIFAPYRDLPRSSMSSSYIRVCYFTSWSRSRPGNARFTPDNVDPFMCTHIIYCFASIVGGKLKLEDGSGLHTGLVELKQVNPSLKVMLAVGGWNQGSHPFLQVVNSTRSLDRFVTSTVEFLRHPDNNFDGLDLDWEYPVNQKAQFVALCKELRLAFAPRTTGEQRLLLSAAVSAGKGVIMSAYDVPAINRELDFITVMTYDLHGTWTGFTELHTRLYAPGDSISVDSVMDYWVGQGADRSKLSLGLATYGHSWTIPDDAPSSVGVHTWQSAPMGRYTNSWGTLAYYEICEMMSAGAEVAYDGEAKVPYLKLGNQWVGYDDPHSIHIKMEYVKEENFAGASVWALGMDDFSGFACGGEHYPLLSQFKRMLPHEDDVDGWVHLHTSFPGCTDLPDGLYEDPDICVVFHHCHRGYDWEKQCPGSLVFDQRHGICNYRRAVGRPGCY